GIERVQAGSTTHRIALMCAEREPLECHRTLLVARELTEAETAVDHIHADGHVESHTDAMMRLLRVLGWEEGELLRTRSQVFEDAYAKQEMRVAYVDPQLAEEVGEARS